MHEFISAVNTLSLPGAIVVVALIAALAYCLTRP